MPNNKIIDLDRLSRFKDNLVNFIQDFDKKLELHIPSVFSNTNIPKIYFSNGKAVCNIPYNDYVYNNLIYIDKDLGNDTNGDGTKNNPYKTIKKGLTVITGDTTFYVKSSTPFQRGEHFTGGSLGTTYKLSFINNNENKKPILLTTGNLGLSWTQEDNVWKTTRSLTKEVLYKTDDEYLFGWRKLILASDLTNCKATTGSYFINGTTVYVNTLDGTIPTDDKYMTIISSGETTFYLSNNEIAFNGFGFICAGADAVYFGTTTTSDVSSKVVLFNCIAGMNDKGNDGGTDVGNGFAFERIKEVFLFNCYAKNTRRDGFNYHYTNASAYLSDDRIIFEYNCVSLNCGLNDTTVNNNGTTCHDKAKIIRVNSRAFNTKGPIVADVNGSYSYLLCCETRNETGTYNGYVFTMDNTGSSYVINCKSNKTLDSADGITYISNYDGIKGVGTFEEI